jgi:imidazolonepropionase-like amidohydrolase
VPAYHLRATLLPDGDAPEDLWISDGRLRLAPVDGAEELTPPGGFALAGLVDCHAHLAMDYTGQGRTAGPALVESNLRDLARAGILLVRDPGSPDGSTVAWQGREGLPRVQAAGRFMAPEGRYLPFGQWVEPGQLTAAALAHVRAGARWVKVVADWPYYDKAAAAIRHRLNYDAATLGAMVAAVHAAGARVCVHSAGPESPAVAIEAGVDSIEHGDGLDADALRACATRGVAWTPTLAMTEVLAGRMERTDDARKRFAIERYDRYRELLPMAARAGVTILAGTDILPHGSIAPEVEALARHGLAPRLALAAATTTARAFLGEPGLAEGAPADLVLFRADPRESPQVLRQPELVLLAGVRVR